MIEHTVQRHKDAWDRSLEKHPEARFKMIKMVEEGMTLDELIDHMLKTGRRPETTDDEWNLIMKNMRSQEFKNHIAGTLGLM